MFGRQRIQPWQFLPRHVHRSGYVAIVMAGSYEEAGDIGRVQATPGSVVVHDAYDGHLDRVGSKGAEILNLDLPASFNFRFVQARHDNPDLLARLAERDANEAFAALTKGLVSVCDSEEDWPHKLALELSDDPRVELGIWCRQMGIRQETVSRRFKAIFGISPKAFRAHARVKMAHTLIARERIPLAHIACQCGFADQSHMSREVKTTMGVTPRALRSSIK